MSLYFSGCFQWELAETQTPFKKQHGRYLLAHIMPTVWLQARLDPESKQCNQGSPVSPRGPVLWLAEPQTEILPA